MPTTINLVTTARFCAVGPARRQIAKAVADLGVDLVDDEEFKLQTCLSELLTNAITHGHGGEVQDGSAALAYGVQIRQETGRIRVWVADPGRSMPQPRQAGADATNGRGLQLVNTLAAAFGWESSPIGAEPACAKIVWFEIAVSALACTAVGSASQAATPAGSDGQDVLLSTLGCLPGGVAPSRRSPTGDKRTCAVQVVGRTRGLHLCAVAGPE
ncbi:ATP-binding protein [Kitasatospora sp. NPDC050463]|uniref:ATP-binding protein n=1 Tax=Kitasatospora sp. NPDC050463 TaxID=3155786 RepID=UPI0033CC3398